MIQQYAICGVVVSGKERAARSVSDVSRTKSQISHVPYLVAALNCCVLRVGTAMVNPVLLACCSGRYSVVNLSCALRPTLSGLDVCMWCGPFIIMLWRDHEITTCMHPNLT